MDGRFAGQGRDRQLRRLRGRFAAWHGGLERAIRGLAEPERGTAAAVLLHRLMFLSILKRAGHLSRNGAVDWSCLQALFRGKVPDLTWLGDLFLPLPIDSAEIRHAARVLGPVLEFLDGPSVDAIDPALLGALFETHINQKEMGAYYTRDDITTYIVDHTLLPWLLDHCEDLADAALRLLRRQADCYVPATVRERQQTQRVRQLQRCETVNGLVTVNADLRRLALDAVRQGGPALAEQVHAALDGLTILDPTCGSGAFLFAAWQLLDELAEATGGSRPPLARKNLFGIDLMPEAVELCRLLMFLRQAAWVKPVKPLPALEAAVAVGNVLQPLPWPARERQGFDVIIGNPPYLSADKVEYAAPDYATAGCPDVYAWVMERSARLLKPGGRCGLIVPLSLGFSERFAACRDMLFEQYECNWFSSFGRIPDALFNFDVRIRNTIHLGQKRCAASLTVNDCYTTRLHRWFEAERAQLFPQLSYASFDPDVWQRRVPKLNGAPLAVALEARLRQSPVRLGDALSPRPTRHILHFKKTAYNWLTFCRRLPPCRDASGRAIPHTQFDTWHWGSAELRDLAFLFLNGKWAFAWWCIVGDDFHVARWMLEGFPIDLAGIPARLRRRLLPLAAELERAMRRAVSFKRNAGKRVGTYNLARCREVTDQSDRLFGEHLGLMEAWNEVERLCAQVIKTEFESGPKLDPERASMYPGP